MTHFRKLLVPCQGSTPKQDQDRASHGLAQAVSQSHLRCWNKTAAAADGAYLLLAVAPYSQYDLTLLDLLEEKLAAGAAGSLPVYVVNLLDYQTLDQLHADFPGVAQAQPTPIAALASSGKKRIASGKQARELAAEALGVCSEEFAKRISAEAPRYVHDQGGAPVGRLPPVP